MASFQSSIVKFMFRRLKFLSSWQSDPQTSRKQMGKSELIFKPHRNVRVLPVQAGSVPAEWLIPPGAPADRALLYIHGGAWRIGSPGTHRGMVSYIAFESGVRALSIDYRLAPENPFPAGLEDCITAYDWLLSNEIPADKIIVAGDSAGGNLTLALLVALRDAGKPLPAGAVALSPATDLAAIHESYHTRANLDPILSNLGSSTVLVDYITSHDPHDPYISPIYADLHGLPPMLIHVGDHEVLLDDSVIFGERARAAGVDARVVVWPEMFHVFQIFVPFVPEARQAVSQIAEFIKARMDDD
jgi:epsilon-lactone hydrolase